MGTASFRPMDELTREGQHVEMLLPDGRHVEGWLFCDREWVRTFWMRDELCRVQRIHPVGWRDLPEARARTEVVLAA